MKNKYIFLFLVPFNCLMLQPAFGQDQLTTDFAPVRAELQDWDSVRGEWLSNSMLAMARNQPIPDRNFPEDFTPSEMMSLVPATRRSNIQAIADNRAKTDRSENSRVWQQVADFSRTNNCQVKSGRSYGDPHLVTFDGKSFSFQTVGEFILANSGSGNVQLQTRQREQDSDFSLTTAAAMFVAGDRVGVYADASTSPNTEDISTPLRINGRAVRLENSTYFLPNGGTVRHHNKTYTVTWPTGEKVMMQVRSRSPFGFMDVTMEISPCNNGGYAGILGNANGNPEDDIRGDRPDMFSTVFMSQADPALKQDMEKQYLANVARELGSVWRVNSMNTLFDYLPGRNTDSYTNPMFPIVHRTVSELPRDRQEEARRKCREQGVSSEEMNGCIFDQGHIGLPPNPRPASRNPADGVVLARIPRDQARPNVNPPAPAPASPSGRTNIARPVSTSEAPEVKEKVPQPATTTRRPMVLATDPSSAETQDPTEKEVIKPAKKEPVYYPGPEETKAKDPIKKPAARETVVTPASSTTSKTPASVKTPAPASTPTPSKPATTITAPASVKSPATPAKTQEPSRTPAPVKSESSSPAKVAKPGRL